MYKSAISDHIPPLFLETVLHCSQPPWLTSLTSHCPWRCARHIQTCRCLSHNINLGRNQMEATTGLYDYYKSCPRFWKEWRTTSWLHICINWELHCRLVHKQSAYQRHRSCKDLLRLAINRCQYTLDSSRYCGVVNADVSTAFDPAQHQKLLEDLQQIYTSPAGQIDSVTSVREVPGTIPTGSRFFCTVTRSIGYSWPGMRVKCIQNTVDSLLWGIHALLDFDVKRNTFTFTFFRFKYYC